MKPVRYSCPLGCGHYIEVAQGIQVTGIPGHHCAKKAKSWVILVKREKKGEGTP